MDLRDKEIMENPDKWPLWPYLPLKRYINEFECEFGFLVDEKDEKYKYVVFLGSLFEKIPLEKREKKIYNSYEEILNDNWIVD